MRFRLRLSLFNINRCTFSCLNTQVYPHMSWSMWRSGQTLAQVLASTIFEAGLLFKALLPKLAGPCASENCLFSPSCNVWECKECRREHYHVQHSRCSGNSNSGFDTLVLTPVLFRFDLICAVLCLTLACMICLFSKVTFKRIMTEEGNKRTTCIKKISGPIWCSNV